MFDEAAIPQLLQDLTLDEKAQLLAGQDFWNTKAIPRLGIPALTLSDGPHGLRKQCGESDHLGLSASVPATCFPSAAGLASSWDPTLLTEMGHALGREAVAQQVGVVLGPGVNLKRSPLCGRNFEYFSEDPLLTARLASALIEGIQAEGIGTSVKHFAVNNQETDRLRVDARVDERTLHELYLSVFERIVKEAHPSTVMCAYNRVNGTYASEHRLLLTTLLREAWGFDGMVVTDWGAVQDRVRGLLAGLDLEMPYSGERNAQRIVTAVTSGELAESLVDQAVERVLRLVAKHSPAVANPGSFDVDDHHELATRIATSTAVLLRNENEALPLDTLDDVVVIGEFARTPRFQGAGSSQISPTRLTPALDALRERRPDLPFAAGYPLADSPVADADAGELRDEAVDLARGRTAVMFLGLPAAEESEGFDRTHINMPEDHIALLHAVGACAERTIVLLSNGAAVEMASWVDETDALLELWLGGQGGGEAAARLLTGEEAPSGRLAESIARALEHHPAQLNFPGSAQEVRYGEGLFIGYRGLHAIGHAPTFPFGHGLAYTTFDFTDLAVQCNAASSLEDTALTASFVVTNAGTRPGVAVPQLYVGRPESNVARPLRELKGWARCVLQPGESESVQVEVTGRELAHWDTRIHGWAVEPGPVTVEVGASSEDLPLHVTIQLDRDPVHVPLDATSTLTEWRQNAAAWRELAPELGDIGMAKETAKEGDVLYALLQDIPLYKVLVLFPDMALTESRLEQIIKRLDQ